MFTSRVSFLQPIPHHSTTLLPKLYVALHCLSPIFVLIFTSNYTTLFNILCPFVTSDHLLFTKQVQDFPSLNVPHSGHFPWSTRYDTFSSATFKTLCFFQTPLPFLLHHIQSLILKFYIKHKKICNIIYQAY